MERKAVVPPTMEQVQAQLVNLQTMFVELVGLLMRAAEKEGDTSMLGVLQEIQRVLGRFEEPPGGAPDPTGSAIFERAMASLSERKEMATDVFEEAVRQIPVRHRPGRPTEQEAKAEAELAERLRKLYRKRRLK